MPVRQRAFTNSDRTGFAGHAPGTSARRNPSPRSYDYAHYGAVQSGQIERNWVGGGNVSALRSYQAHHPNAAIYTVEYRGRTVWMTSKQHAIWREVRTYWRRGKRDTLARIAKVVGCSRATVSRFLRRLDLWRFIDLASLRGRNGGTFVFTRKWEEFRRWTESARQRIRRMLATRVKRWQREELAEQRMQSQQGSIKVGSTGATLG